MAIGEICGIIVLNNLSPIMENYPKAADRSPANLKKAYLQFLKQAQAQEKTTKQEAHDWALNQLVLAADEISEQLELEFEPSINSLSRLLTHKSLYIRQRAEEGFDTIVDILAEEDPELEHLVDYYDACWRELWEVTNLHECELAEVRDKKLHSLVLEAFHLLREARFRLLLLMH